jgi:uncharacterized protein YkwD
MQTLPEEKRKKVKSQLIKVSATIALAVVFIVFIYFTNVSNFIINKPLRSYPSVSRSISNMSEKVSNSGTGSQTAEGNSKNNPVNNYDSVFSKDIAIGQEPQVQTDTSQEENNTSSGNNTENTDSDSGNIDVGGITEEDANTEGTSTEDATIEDTSENADTKDTNVETVETADIDDVNSGSFAAALLNMINAARLENGLPALNINQSVNAIAQYRSRDMIERNYFSHQTPEGKRIDTILPEFGITYAACGENIQYASPPSSANPESFFNTWMDSDLHRANMLSGNFSQIGIGVSNNNDRLIAVLVFIN